MKVAMMNFDQPLFLKTYDGLLTNKTFRDIYNDVFIPLLEQIGYLWQSGTITPAHEQFISNLIKQKLFMNIEHLQKVQPIKDDKVFVLFLPEEEIHDIGLFYANYELLSHGYKVIFLGQSLPMEDLSYLSKLFETTVFISYLTTKPENLDEYVEKFTKHICTHKKCEYWILGRKAQEVLDEGKALPERVKAFSSINHLTFSL
jgi:methanogenic corrinoid protein MtbC1